MRIERGVVLPTAQLLREHSNMEELFSFYDGGLGGVIHTLVVSYSDPEGPDIVEAILHDYLQTPEAKLDLMFGKMHKQELLEVVLEWLKVEVDRLMFRFFAQFSFHVDGSRLDWLGHDLVIYASPTA